MKKIAAALSLFSLPLISLSHPGHGNTDGYTITHYFTEPDHVSVTIAVLIVAVLYFRNVKKKQRHP